MTNAYQDGEVFEKPWWKWEALATGDTYCVKRLTVNPGAVLSLQLHHHRQEHWVVVEWVAEATRDGEVIRLHPWQSIEIPHESKHRISNPGDTDMIFIETQYGEDLREDDIIRFEDVYGREGTNQG